MFKVQADLIFGCLVGIIYNIAFFWFGFVNRKNVYCVNSNPIFLFVLFE